MAGSTVPKFGNWESGENVSYSTCFENANARRVSLSSVERMNTKSSLDNPNFNFKQDAQKRTAGNLTPQRPPVSGDALKRTAGLNGGGARSAGQSPLHSHYQAKLGIKEIAAPSPSREKRNSYEGTLGLAPLTPGRSRLRSVPRGSETPERGASVPKFGEWDETDPSSADGFSQIFNQVKEERHDSMGNASSRATDSRRSNGQKHLKSNDSKVGCFCFPWGTK